MQPQPPTPTVDDYLDLSFKAIVEQSITGIYVIQDEIFVYSNETWAQFFGRSRSEIVGMSLRDLVPLFTSRGASCCWRCTVRAWPTGADLQ